MNKRVAVRFIIGLFALAIFVLGYQWLKENAGDPDFGSADTAGMIAAIEKTANGTRAVLFSADGKKIESPGYKDGVNDREIVWRPDGQRVFFVSNRDDKNYQIYRWHPAKNSIERRSFGSRSKSNPSFSFASKAIANQLFLITAGGFVLEFKPSDGSTRQVLPPVEKDAFQRTGAEGGISGQFDRVYEKIGSSFKEARWLPGSEVIVAVMRRDVGEVLMVQSFKPVQIKPGDPDSPWIIPPPVPVIAGEQIEMDVSSAGRVVIAVTHFQFVDPENRDALKPFLKNGRLVPPYKNAILFFDPLKANPPVLLAISPDNQAAFRYPKLSPSGEEVVLCIGPVSQEGDFQPRQLAIFPLKEAAAGQAKILVNGEVRDPSWHPGGKVLVYTKRLEKDLRAIFTIESDGTREKNLTEDQGSFSRPSFSPQSQ